MSSRARWLPAPAAHAANAKNVRTRLRLPIRGDGLLTTTALLGLLAWLGNDHVLKHLTPGVLTGKLSDVASLIVLPLALQAAWELCDKREPFVPSRVVSAVAYALVGAFFVWMETTALGSLAFRSVLALAQWPLHVLREADWVTPRLVAHRADLEDLLTLPSLLLPYRLGLQRSRAGSAAKGGGTPVATLTVSEPAE